MPVWPDIAAAMESAITSDSVPLGMRPMIKQAINEINQLRTIRDRYYTLLRAAAYANPPR